MFSNTPPYLRQSQRDISHNLVFSPTLNKLANHRNARHSKQNQDVKMLSSFYNHPNDKKSWLFCFKL